MLLMGKHFWIALVLATLLLKIVIAPLRIRRSAPHRSAPTSAASLRTVRQDTDIHRLRSQDIHLTPSQGLVAILRARLVAGWRGCVWGGFF